MPRAARFAATYALLTGAHEVGDYIVIASNNVSTMQKARCREPAGLDTPDRGPVAGPVREAGGSGFPNAELSSTDTGLCLGSGSGRRYSTSSKL